MVMSASALVLLEASGLFISLEKFGARVIPDERFYAHKLRFRVQQHIFRVDLEFAQ